MMNNMKMLNENELNQVSGGVPEWLDRIGRTEILNDEMVETFCDNVVEGFSIVKYILSR